MLGPKTVLVVGTGTIGEPLLGLLCNFKAQLGIDEVLFHKRTPLLSDRSKVQDLQRRGARLVTDKDRVDGFTKMGLPCFEPKGAFYIFPDISEAVFGEMDPAGRVLETAQAFAESLLEHARVAVVPGEDFGAPNHVRLSFATSMEQIDKGMDRFEAFVASLQPAAARS